jgi:hypothetical protein
MFKKIALALFGLVIAITLISPPKATAQIRFGVRIGSPEPYGTVVVQPAPYVVYDEPYYVSHNWNSGYHEGYYYGHGQRYRRDDRGYRHYDNRYRDGRFAREHHDHGYRGR